MSAAHAFRWVMAIGCLSIAVFALTDPKRHLPYAYASALVFFGLAISQLANASKDAMSFLDGLALIVIGVASGLLLSESIRRYLAEKRERVSQSMNAAPNGEKAG